MFLSQNNNIFINLLTPASLFMVSSMVINAGNYGYNLILGRALGPEAFAEAGLILSLLLVLSLFGMGFQLTATRFRFLNDHDATITNNWMQLMSIFVGVIAGIIIMLLNSQITEFFHLSSPWIVIIFGLILPFYLLLSVQRGRQQGDQSFIALSGSYQKELWVKIGVSLVLLLVFPNHYGVVLALALLISIVSGLPSFKIKFRFGKLPRHALKNVLCFLSFTLFYELVQVLINYGDLLMVKHYFDNVTAGLYTSMSLVGRMIYFITWMMVMVLIPKVIQRRKEGKRYRFLLFRYMGMVAALSAILVSFTAFLPEFSVNLLFGSEYLSISPILWKYALASSLFALGNLLIYFFIATDQFFPVLLAAAIAFAQIIVYQFFHHSLEAIIHVQVFGMSALLILEVLIFISKSNAFKSANLNLK